MPTAAANCSSPSTLEATTSANWTAAPFPFVLLLILAAAVRVDFGFIDFARDLGFACDSSAPISVPSFALGFFRALGFGFGFGSSSGSVSTCMPSSPSSGATVAEASLVRGFFLGFGVDFGLLDSASADVSRSDFEVALGLALALALPFTLLAAMLASSSSLDSSSKSTGTPRLRVDRDRVGRGSWHRIAAHKISLSSCGVESARKRARFGSVCVSRRYKSLIRAIEQSHTWTDRMFPFVTPSIRRATVSVAVNSLSTAAP